MEEKIPKTSEELKKIAVDLYEGRIFCDRHIEDATDLRIVFMPIALGAFAESSEDELKNIGMIYEYLEQAGPRSVNGYPSFFSLNILTKDETKIMFDHYENYKKLKEEFEAK